MKAFKFAYISLIFFIKKGNIFNNKERNILLVKINTDTFKLHVMRNFFFRLKAAWV